MVSRDGSRIERFAPVTTPESLDKKIADWLAE
jgi:glutathione peroxidase-family protein